ncbi:MAG: hypothetical protein KBT34_03715 [Prevotella sp.]|nr:hypothetical protein [Candidatus Prevotella equi]
MKTSIASIMLLLTIALICLPISVVWFAFVCNYSAIIRAIIFLAGLILCRLVKPLSIITGKDLKYI